MRNQKWKDFYDKYLRNSMAVCFLVAFALNLIIETLARQSEPGFGGILYMVRNPLVFLANTLLIMATLCIATLFRRRMFILCFIASVWLAIGLGNGVILMHRMTPFTMKDLTAAAEGMAVLTNYFSVPQIVAIAVGLVVYIVFFVVLFLKGPKKKTRVKLKRNLAGVLIVFLLTFGMSAGLIKVGLLSTFFGNLAYAYEDYGVPYCFINTWLNQGIHRPSGYSEETIHSIVKNSGISETGVSVPEPKEEKNTSSPNILFLQLESFVDPTLFNNVKYSGDPIPYFRELMKTCSSGSLTVPACGAGTANTEFETMTGISVKFFGPGEYPFKSVLHKKTAESIATDLKYFGYGTHAIHNHRALFYNRNTVFDNIGFDTYTSLEYMSDAKKTPKNWAKDKILTSQIMDALKSTEERDYIYTISVQGHGKYPTEPMLGDPKIQVTQAPSEEAKNQFEYYCNQVYEMDQFVHELTETLEKYPEPVILVMYGDHIPAMEITEETYDAKDLYQTQYVIWSNYGMKKKDKDLTTYQLGAEVLKRAGVRTGTIIKYHQNVKHDSARYLADLKLLAYDMLYGKQYVYGGSNPFEPAGMQMGVKEISIDEIVKVGEKYYIKGQNFTEHSRVTLNGKVLDTVYLGPTLLALLEEVDPEDASKMKVSQIDKNNETIISTTE